MITRPMKAARGLVGEPLAPEVFPLWGSPKLDGIRALTVGGELLTSKMKLVPNGRVRALFDTLPDGLDGELILGDPQAANTFQRTSSVVMSSVNVDREDVSDIRYYLFDYFGMPSAGYLARWEHLESRALKLGKYLGWKRVHLILPTRLDSYESLRVYEDAQLRLGYEGVVLRAERGIYKEGRSTRREMYSMKRVPTETFEMRVVGVEERMTNTNALGVDERGYAKRRKLKSGMRPTGMLGALVGVYRGMECRVGTGFTGRERIDLWNKRESLVGLLAKCKSKGTGALDRPREPVFLGWRDKRD